MPNDANLLFAMIMPLMSYGKPSDLSDDDIATYTDALANYSAVLHATLGPEAALTKNDRNLKLSLERFRRRPAQIPIATLAPGRRDPP